MADPNHRWGIRYSSDSTKNLAYIQAQYNNDNSFAKPGELFLNEALDELYYVDATGVARKLGDRDSDTGSLRVGAELLLAKQGANVPSITGAAFTSPKVIPLTSPSLNLSGSVGLDSFSLANGKEGQIIYFIIGNLGSGFYAQNIKIKIANANYTVINGSNVSKIKSSAIWRPFYDQTGNTSSPTMATAIYAGGSWNLSSGYVTSDINSVFGRVLDSSGNPIAGVNISYSGGQLATTDVNGIYSFSGVGGAQKITASKSGYFSTFFVVDIFGPITLNFSLQETAGIQSALPLVGITSGSVTATGTARASNNAEIVLPQNSVVDSAGNPVDEAILKVGNIVVSDQGSVDIFPGYFLGEVSGLNQPIESYGYLNVSLETSSGDPLYLDPAIGATIRLPLDPDPVAENVIDTWRLNETTGIWEKTGQATRVGVSNVFEFNVTTFSWYNIDKPLDRVCQLTINAWDTPPGIFEPANPSGIPAAGVNINVNVDDTFSAWGRPSLWQGRCTTDINGKCVLSVPPGYLRVIGEKNSRQYNGFYYTQSEGTGGCEALINIHWSLPQEVPPPLPSINNISVSSGFIVIGQELTLIYDVSNAATVDIVVDVLNDGEVISTSNILSNSTTTSGQVVYTPTVTGLQSFTITATSPNGTTVQSNIVTEM